MKEYDIEKIINDFRKDENRNRNIFLRKNKTLFKAVVFNGEKWNSEQNLYSDINYFKVIDDLVYICCNFCYSYYRYKYGKNPKNFIYLEAYNRIFKCTIINAQCAYGIIEYIRNTKNIKTDKVVNLDSLISFIKDTDHWRTFQVIDE